ncbi:MAG: hypothetical protein V7750_18885, partial [Sneathiella sp.]
STGQRNTCIKTITYGTLNGKLQLNLIDKRSAFSHLLPVFFRITLSPVNKFLSIFACMLVAFSAFLQWMPHGAAHAIHVQQVSHSDKSSNYSESHDHSADHTVIEHLNGESDAAHHAIDLDIVTYYNDYLKMDLSSSDRSPSLIALKIKPNMVFDFAPTLLRPRGHDLTSVSISVFTDWNVSRRSYPPVYLSTHRFRV